jgi:predicted metal-binding protein
VTREPGDRPSIHSRAGRGASAGQQSAAGGRHAIEHPESEPLEGVRRVRLSSANTTTKEPADAAVVGPTTIHVCITCRRPTDPDSFPRPGALLARATANAAMGTNIAVRRVRCLANCSRALSAAIACERRWTYVFGDLDPAQDAAALVQAARLLAAATDGLMPWRDRPAALKRGLIARIPPCDHEDAE